MKVGTKHLFSYLWVAAVKKIQVLKFRIFFPRKMSGSDRLFRVQIKKVA